MSPRGLWCVLLTDGDGKSNTPFGTGSWRALHLKIFKRPHLIGGGAPFGFHSTRGHAVPHNYTKGTVWYRRTIK